MTTTKRLVPFVAIHAGEYLNDELHARQMSQAELAHLTGINDSVLSDIISGKQEMTLEYSCLIGKALGLNENFFYKLQEEYNLDRMTQPTLKVSKVQQWVKNLQKVGL